MSDISAYKRGTSVYVEPTFPVDCRSTEVSNPPPSVPSFTHNALPKGRASGSALARRDSIIAGRTGRNMDDGKPIREMNYKKQDTKLARESQKREKKTN